MRELISYQLVRLAATPELDPNVVVPAVATLIGVLGAAFIANRVSKGRSKPPEVAEPPAVPPSPLASFSGTQNEFMALVIQDNEAIRTEVAGIRTEVATLRTELEAARSSHGAFERAVRRYLETLAGLWTGPDPMPWPADDDLGILKNTLPRRPRGPRRAN